MKGEKVANFTELLDTYYMFIGKTYLPHSSLQICVLKTLQLVEAEAPNLGDLTEGLIVNPRLLQLADDHIPLQKTSTQKK